MQEKHIKQFKSDNFYSHGAIMNGYVLFLESLVKDVEKLAEYLNEN